MKISEQQTLQFGETKSTYSQEGGHASQFPQQENEKEKKMYATCGQKTLEQFGRFNRASLWAKMFAGLLIGKGEFYSTRCKLTWKLKATKCSRFYCQLQVSTLPTDEIGFGLLPTPTVVDSAGTTELSKIDARRKRMKARNNGKNGTKYSGNGFGMTLGEMLQRGLLPTPPASDWKGEYTMETVEKRDRESSRGVRLPEEIVKLTGSTSQLNPLFVQEMMGFPSNWLTLPFQEKTEPEFLVGSKPMEDGEKKV
jgi:hypothetical protein